MTPDAKRRVASALMAEQFNRSVSQDTLAQPMAPGTEVAERSFFLPLGTYSDGRTGIAWPGIATEPAAAWSGLLNRAMNTGYVSGDTQNTEDAFNVAGAAMVGGLAAPRPRGSIGMSGRPEGAAVNAAGERQGGEGLLNRLMSMFRGASAEPLRGYRGDIYAERRNPNMYWAATDPAIASDYAMVGGSSRQPGYSPNVQPAEFRFKNPLEIDAQGSSWEKVPSPYGTTSTDEIATLAQNAQHDGVVFRNVHDPIGDVDGQVGTTIAALKRGTVYSPMTGELLFANGGRPGAAVGAVSTADIVKALMEDDANKYRGAI